MKLIFQKVYQPIVCGLATPRDQSKKTHACQSSPLEVTYLIILPTPFLQKLTTVETKLARVRLSIL